MTKRCIMRYMFILLALYTSPGFAGSEPEGSITYVSRDNAYMDLGKKMGIQVGDTVRVSREKLQLGIATVTQVSTSSSSLTPIDSANIHWAIGDVVKPISSLLPLIPEITVKTEQDTSAVSVIQYVFLDSSAFQSRKPSVKRLTSDIRIQPSARGYISTRYIDIGGDSSSFDRSTASVNAQLQIQDLGIRYLDANVFLRGRQSSTDTTLDAKLYSVMLSYSRPSSRFSYQFGRMYHRQFSMLGTVDGVGVSWQGESWLFAVLLGNQAPLTNSGNQTHQKSGIVAKKQRARSSFEFGSILDRTSTQLSRNYVFGGTTFRASSNFRIRSYGELDLDLTDVSQFQPTFSLTRFRTTARWRWRRSLRSTLRYSYRENIIDLSDTTSFEPDAAARHALSGSLGWIFPNGVSLTSQGSFRTDGSGKSVETLGITLNASRFTPWDLRFGSGIMGIASYVSRGGRIYVSAEKTLTPRLRLDIYDEIFAYQILGDQNVRVRHLPEIGCSIKLPLLNRLRVRLRFEQEDGVTIHRFSLSASQQF